MRKRGDWGHAKGTFNIDYNMIATKASLISNPSFTDSNKKEQTKLLDSFFYENRGFFPMYYTTTGYREYVIINQNLQIGLSLTEGLFTNLETGLAENNIAYLGTNEGWVNLKIERI